MEVAVTSDGSGQLWNTSIWDVSNGTTLMTYKDGVSARRSLNLIGTDYLISAKPDKPLLQVWALGRREQLQMRMVCPGLVSCLAVSPDGVYCVGGVENKLYVWQVASGNLLAVLTHHFQSITCVQFTDDTSHVVSGGEDGMVVVWSLSSVLSQSEYSYHDHSHAEPYRAWTHHSLPVTDVHVGIGGIRSRVATSSLDQTCKLYEISSGHLLLSVIFDIGLTSVVLDPAEMNIYVGSQDGQIFTVNLLNPPRTQEYHLSDDEKKSVFLGHNKPVTCLSVSMDGSTLLSGSSDETVRVWHIHSRQCTRILPHKGPVTNAFLTLAPQAIFSPDPVKPSLVIRSFEKVRKAVSTDNPPCILIREEPSTVTNITAINQAQSRRDTSSDKPDVVNNENLHKVNKALYDFAVKKILEKL